MRWDLISIGIGLLTWLVAPAMPEIYKLFFYALSAGFIAYGLAPALLRTVAPKGRRMWPILLFVAGVAITTFATMWIFHEREQPPASSQKTAGEHGATDFRVTFYHRSVGETVVTGTGNKYLNPVLLLLRIDNVGLRPSAIFEPALVIELDGQRHVGERHLIQMPIQISPLVAISPSNDFYEKGVAPVAPGHSVTGALWYIFPMLEKGKLVQQKDAAAYTFEFKDVYGKQHSFPIPKFDYRPRDVKFPDIKYQ